jgi:maleamate amidohydrolase
MTVSEASAGSEIARIWEPFLTERDRAVMAAGGFAQPMGYGKRPALLIMDADQFGRDPSPGEAVAVTAIGRLLRAARARRIPVMFVTASSRLPSGADLTPSVDEIIVVRNGLNAFHGTPLNSFMMQLGVDSLLICGCGTSAAVRSTLIEAFCANYRCALIADACWDLIEISHAMTLFDLCAKHSDVRSSADVTSFVSTLAEGLFPNLPERPSS